ncbi:MAG: FAD-binding oxidoreductase [Methylobacteriaceae bacterium]|jgi:glycine/D-amino acid oxidase-like deaminating enzyme|nr:FAD-binding oxidoreductase [Methylobacteriaceae bacterium]
MIVSDAVVVGAGVVGASIAYGLLREGLSVELLDEGDAALRASRGNFGLVWVSGKGATLPDYALWTLASADAWAGHAAGLEEETGLSVGYHKPGGVDLCFSDEELEQKRALLQTLNDAVGAERYQARMLTRQEVLDIIPTVGPDVVGAGFCPHDGHCGSLSLLRALHAAYAKRKGTAYRAGEVMLNIRKVGTGYAVLTRDNVYKTRKIVLAAGLGNKTLGPLVGIDSPVFPLKGQVLATERTALRVDWLTPYVRQTDEGYFLLGDSMEHDGFNTFSNVAVIRGIARRSLRSFPFLKDLRLVRTWAALRVMTADGYPVYDESERFPGVFSIGCHSGVTLSAVHATRLARMIADGALAPEVSAFSARRFDVQEN